MATHVTGNPFPRIGERSDAGTPDFVRISGEGQVSGTGPEVGTTSAVASDDGLIWRISLSTARRLNRMEVSFASGVLTGDNIFGGCLLWFKYAD